MVGVAPDPSGRSARREISDAEYRALAQFRRALRAFLSLSEEAARQVGLTPAQHQLLLAVRGADQPGGPSVREVADALKLRHHSAVELIDRAQAAGLVVRVADEEDRRRQRLELTPSGRDKLEQLSEEHRSELRRLRDEAITFLETI